MTGPDDPSGHRPDRSPDRPADERPGAAAWAVIAVGWIVMATAVAGALRDERLGSAGSWGIWLVGSAVVHDALALPVVLGVGWLVWRACPPSWRAPVRAALVVGGVLTLTTWPIARRWGARSDNPSILPLPVGRNLAIMVAVLAVLAVAAGSVAHVRHRRDGDSGGGTG